MVIQLENTILQKVNLSEEELQKVKSLFTPRKLKKRHFLLNEGEVCKYNIYVEEGLLRLFSIEEDGYEQVVQFASEGWWMSDLSSFFSEDQAIYSIEALEDSQVLLLTRDSLDKMLDEIPKMERYFRLLMQNHIIAQQRRIIASLRLTAEERYEGLIKSMPTIINRVPQQFIASFLGMTPETLSRVRKQVSER